ncbi:MAG: class I SAM-dependent methyltransferase [Brevibacterium sp.]|nr:class I SAM-dependent methyltransferase [Brevibacterium sp.]MDN5908108.1 class I SAM-dependent methyltransferase [Brevibacterium sp.]MDN6124356.1 class I SAM-dependent methyltransferase [Brevibacterium sp.]MDN6665363.1 class I SAM-dependent methyltransferase [Brevibacterium sp.]
MNLDSQASNRAYEDELLAAIYDEDNPDGPDHDYFRELALELSATRITDLGCGTGILTATLTGPGRTVVGIDPAEAMLEHAAARPGGDTVEWRLGTSELIEPDSSDLIVMSGNVAMHILGDAWTATLSDISRGLRTGGVLAFEARNPLAQAWRNWNKPVQTRETAAGSLRETTTTSAPDDEGIITMDSVNEFHDADQVISVSQRLQFRTFDTLRDDLSAAGMGVRDVWRNWDRTPFTGSADEPLMIIEAVNADDLHT